MRDPPLPRSFHRVFLTAMAARAVSLPVSSTSPGGPGGAYGGAGGIRGPQPYVGGPTYAGPSYGGAGGSGSDSGYRGLERGGSRASPLLLSSFTTTSKEVGTGQTVMLEARVERVEVVETVNNNNNNDMANLNIDNNNNTANTLNEVVFLPMNG